jgi:FkbM family methyltransferase
MPTKTLNLIGRQFEIEGVGVDDTYFLGLTDGIDTDFATIIRSLLPTDSIALDIGANIGITSCLLSQHLRDGQIYSYEPSPSVFPILNRNMSKNTVENVAINQKAVGAEKGTLGFYGVSAYGHLIQANDNEKMSGEVTVDVVTIDDLVHSHGLERVDFIKIDVEGFEGEVLTGGQKTEERHTPLYYMEFSSYAISTIGELNPLDLARRVLSEFEYVYLVDRDGYLQGPLNDPADLVRTNIVDQGSVSNLLMTNSPKRLEFLGVNSVVSLVESYRKSSASEAERDHALAERDHALAERDHALAERDHARRYPWKYFRSSLKQRR